MTTLSPSVSILSCISQLRCHVPFPLIMPQHLSHRIKNNSLINKYKLIIINKPTCIFIEPISTTIKTTKLHKTPHLYFSLNSTPYILMEPSQTQTQVYSVWAIPPDDVAERLNKIMQGLRSEFGGPQFQPHVTVVGAISLTENDALDKFKTACNGLKAYNALVDRVATGTFFYQCVFLLLHSTQEVVEASEHCCGHFGYKRDTTYMPHLSLLYADLTEDEKKKAQEKANSLDESINGLSFPINRLQLWKTDTKDNTLKSWEKVAEYTLPSN